MTHSFKTAAILSVGLLAIGGSALAQQPPDVVQSDAWWDTAMGTGALQHLEAGPTGGGGFANTAVGSNALSSNTNGSGNTATGYAALSSNTTGFGNVANGVGALIFNTTGYSNTAIGYDALYTNTLGVYNTATGIAALVANTTGAENTANGSNALRYNSTGNGNTGVGYDALYGVFVPRSGGVGTGASTGANNTAIGVNALYSYSSGSNNTASGGNALYSNTTGNDNTAYGSNALYSNAEGSNNTAVGQSTLYESYSGNGNAAMGYAALVHNSSGDDNVAVGLDALKNSTTGSYNIAVGYGAGDGLTTTSNNIDIGNIGENSDAGIIRIGTAGTQTAAYIAGIENSKVTGSAVYITSKGQLGVLASSERYKTAIQPIGSNTGKLAQLRPVSFHLKTDPNGAVQYGLIAEEVAQVYPELVIRDDAGNIQGVRYDELAPMLLSEVQKQTAEIRDLKHQEQQKIVAQDAKILGLEQQVAELVKLRSKDRFIAQR